MLVDATLAVIGDELRPGIRSSFRGRQRSSQGHGSGDPDSILGSADCY